MKVYVVTVITVEHGQIVDQRVLSTKALMRKVEKLMWDKYCRYEDCEVLAMEFVISILG